MSFSISGEIAELAVNSSGIPAEAATDAVAQVAPRFSGISIAEIVDGNGWSNNNWDQSVTYNTRPAFGEHHTPEGQEEYVVDVTAEQIAAGYGTSLAAEHTFL